MKENRNWTNEERVTNYRKLLGLHEWTQEQWEAELKHFDNDSRFGDYIRRRVESGRKRIERLKLKINFFANVPGESTDMPAHLMQ